MIAAQTKVKIDALCHSARQDEQHNAALFHFALHCFSQGEMEAAIFCLHRLDQLQPGIAEIHYTLGVIYLANQRLVEAEGAFRDATAVRPAYPEAWQNLGKVLLQREKFAEAEECFVLVTRLDPQADEAFRYLGQVCLELGKYDQALQAYKSELSLAPDRLECRIDIGLTYLRQGAFAKAAQEFQAILTIDQSMSEVHFNLALTYHKQQKFQLAEKYYQQALAVNPENVGAHNNLGIILDIMGRRDEAIAHYQEIVRLEPDNQGVQHILAALSGEQPRTAVPEYVVSLFDQYSAGFDVELVQHLKYTIPAQIRETVDRYLGGQVHFANVLDLGCGTGMCGEELWGMATQLTGVDLSSKMLGQAARKGVYDALHNQDIVQFLQAGQQSYDLFVAADVFIYVGDLDDVFQAVQQRSCQESVFAFSVERCSGNSFKLCSSGRYAHSRNYIHHLADKYSFLVEKEVATGIRLENNRWIEGDIYVLKSTATVPCLFLAQDNMAVGLERGLPLAVQAL